MEEALNIEKLVAERDLYKRKLDEALSDIENIKKRMTLDKDNNIMKGKVEVLDEMMDVTDDFIRAIVNNHKTDNPDVLKEGFEMIYYKLRSTFKKLKVQLIYPTKKDKFSDAVMEAVATTPCSNPFYDGYVAKTIKSGYILNNAIIKYAQVVVYKYNS